MSRRYEENVIPLTSGARSAAEKFGAAHDRELLTILFTDLVDSTRLQSELGNAEAARLTELHRTIVRGELAKYEAREIEWAGDSCLAVFTKPSDAVAFALRMQMEHLRAREGEPRLPLVRVGIHLGEIVVRRRDDGGKKTEDLFGLQVSEAARIMSVARGNQIYCTRAVFDSARGSLRGDSTSGLGETLWVRHGLYLLKGSDEPVEICEIGNTELGQTSAPEQGEKCVPMGGGTSEPRSLFRRISGIGVLAIGGIAAALVIGYFAVTGRLSSREVRESNRLPNGAVTPGAAPEASKVVKRSYLGLSIPPYYSDPAITPDGSAVVYVTRGDDIGTKLAVQEFGKLKGRILENTDGAVLPFISPDGKFVGYENSDERRFDRIPIGGGTPITITEFLHSDFTCWHGDYIYFGAVGHQIMRAKASGGAAERITKISDTGGGGHVFPCVLPDDRGILFTSFASTEPSEWETWVTNGDEPPTRVLSSGHFARYIPTGHLVYFKDDVAMVAPFDLETRSVIGEAVPVDEEGLTPTYTFSTGGTMVYFARTDPESQGVRTLTWVDMKGNLAPLSAPPKDYMRVRISPDGARAVIAASRDIWLLEFDRVMLQRMTRKVAFDNAPIFIDDGLSIVFSSDRGGSPQMYIMPTVPDVDGSEMVPLTAFGPPRYAEAWDKQGQRIIYSQFSDNETKFDIGMGYFGAEGDNSYGPVVQTSANEGTAALSPDGKWVAYVTDEVADGQIYVAEFPSFGNKYPISIDGGTEPVWAADGSAIYFRKYPAMMRADVHAGETFSAETPVELFSNPSLLASPAGARMYDVHPDGDRFLMIALAPENEQKRLFELVVVENWFEHIKSIAPYPGTD